MKYVGTRSQLDSVQNTVQTDKLLTRQTEDISHVIVEHQVFKVNL
jgi:hypothetical protein